MHDGSLLSGAIAFYALLSLAPLGVLTLAIVGVVMGADQARIGIEAELAVFLGEEVAQGIGALVERASESGPSLWATLFSGLFILFATTRLFWMLRAALNYVWGIRSTTTPGFRGLRWQVLRRRLFALVMVFSLGGALVGVTFVKATLASSSAHFGGIPFLYRGIDISVSIVALGFFAGLVYRWLPDASIAWRDALMGGGVTATLATIGALVIGHYIGRFGLASVYGAAGTLIIFLLWVYYTTQIFFFGAAFTHAWALHRGKGVTLLPHAVQDESAHHPLLRLDATIGKELGILPADGSAPIEEE